MNRLGAVLRIFGVWRGLPGIATLAIICGALCGCTLLNTSALPFGKKQPKFHIPRQIVPVWSETVRHQSGTAPTRGFGGRVMFYGPDRHKPVLVDGSLIVYAWDDSERSTERAPDRKYVFPAENLASHYSLSRIGHSYSFWVPWDAAGGAQQKVTLICRFVDRTGAEVTSGTAHVVLPGTAELSSRPAEPDPATRSDLIKAADEPAADAAPEVESSTMSRIRQASFESSEPVQSGSRPRTSAYPGLRSSAISVPAGFRDRNMQRRGPTAVGHDPADLLAPQPAAPQSAAPTFPAASPTAADGAAAQLRTQASAERLPSADDQGVSVNPGSAEFAQDGAGRGLRSAHLPRFESRVQASRAAQSAAGHVRKAPLRAGWLHGLPETPRRPDHAVP